MKYCKHYLVLAVLIVNILMANIVGILPSFNFAHASGISTFTDNITSSAECSQLITANVAESWNYHVNLPEATTENSGGIVLGWVCASSSDKYTQVSQSLIGFKLTGFPDGVDVVGARIKLYGLSLSNQGSWNPHIALYQAVNTDDTIEVGDYDAWDDAPGGTHNRITNAIAIGDINLSGGLNTFTVSSGYYDWISTPDVNDRVWVMFSTDYQATIAPPLWSQYDIFNLAMYGSGGPYYPSLEIDYIESTPGRVTVGDTNAAIDAETDGTEVADNITWVSPRNMYADEIIRLKVNGDSGAAISLELKDESGNVLDEVEDSIRVDGNYDYTYDLPDNWYGFIRLLETNFNLASEWGYVMPKPSSSQENSLIYAVDTGYPQYDYAFDDYVKAENDIGVIHWKSNVQAGEESDHSLRIWGNSDNETYEYFNHTLDWLNTNYYKADDANEFLTGWRYFIFSPHITDQGFEDYDGLVYDLNIPYSLARAGYLHAVIIDDTDSSLLADSHSCYWYLHQNVDGIQTWLNGGTFAGRADINLTVQVGEACQALENLPNLKIEVVGDDDSTIYSTVNEFYQVGQNEYTVETPAGSGNYQIRLTFSGDASWSYIHDIPFKVTGISTLTPTDITTRIKNTLKQVGMDNPAGYWMVTIIGMVALFLIFYKSSVLRVVVPLVFFGYMFTANFIDKWLVILLGIGAGLSLFGILRKKTHGGGSPEG